MKNIIAKYAHKSNRCIAFTDKTKYSRKDKWGSEEPPRNSQLFLGGS